MSDTGTDALRFVAVAQDDPLATPLIEALAVEYARALRRHPRPRARLVTRGYPASEFEPPDGDLVVGLLGGEPVTGGAFRRFDDTTAELKRIWTEQSAPPARTRSGALVSGGWRPRSPPGPMHGST